MLVRNAKQACGRLVGHHRTSLNLKWKLIGLGTMPIGIRHKSTGSTSEIVDKLPHLDAQSLQNGSETAIEGIGVVNNALSNQIGYLQSIGLAETWYWPSDIVQHSLEIVHVYTGLPWWGAICAVTVLARVLMFPMYVKSSDTMARNSKIKPELDKLQAELVAAPDLAAGQRIALRRRQLMKKHGIKNRWLVAPMLQLPLALGFFNGLRHMANYPVEGFASEGLLWIKDLTQPDPYLGMQFITAAVLISFIRMGGETGAQNFSPAMKKMFTILPLVSIPATMNLSAAVVLYFAVNGFCSVIQTSVLRNKWIRKKLNIAEVATPLKKTDNEPQKGIIETFRDHMAKSKEQAAQRQRLKQQEEATQKINKELSRNSRIKIVPRTQLKKNKTQ